MNGGDFRFPLLVLWAAFFGVFATASTVWQVHTYRAVEKVRRGEMPSKRSRQTLLVSGIGIAWCAAIWVVVEKFREFRLPVPFLSALFFGVLATLLMTVLQVQLYRAVENEQSGE